MFFEANNKKTEIVQLFYLEKNYKTEIVQLF